MRDFADLPNDLPRPPMGSTPKPAEPPAPPPPPPPPRLIAQGVWEDPVTKHMWTTLAPPVCDRHANVEMMLRDRFGGNEAAVEEMLAKEALGAEDTAIRKLNAEAAIRKLDAEAVQQDSIRGDVQICTGAAKPPVIGHGLALAAAAALALKTDAEILSLFQGRLRESMGLSPTLFEQGGPRSVYRRAYPEIIPAWQR